MKIAFESKKQGWSCGISYLTCINVLSILNCLIRRTMIFKNPIKFMYRRSREQIKELEKKEEERDLRYSQFLRWKEDAHE